MVTNVPIIDGGKIGKPYRSKASQPAQRKSKKCNYLTVLTREL